jgi:hypothetical protein
MSEKNLKPRARRKLSRSQIQEILERNVKLYRDEESFVPYLLELAIYLLEYEYNWDDSGAQPPPNLPQLPEDVEAVGGVVDRGDQKIFHKITTSASASSGERLCPHCGFPTDDAYVCHNCKNLTR